MNTERSDFDRTLRHWFEDDPTSMSDRVVDGIATRIARQPQRRAWRLQGRPVMNLYAKLAAAAAAILVVGLIGWQLLPGGGPGGQPTPAPTAAPTVAPSSAPSPSGPAPTPTSTILCEDDIPGCAGPLPAGSASSTNFAPAFAFTATAGWANSADRANLYKLDSSGGDSLLLWSDVAISQHTATCDAVKMKGVGNKVQDWIDFVTGHPGLTATNLVPVSLGTVSGQVVDLIVKPDWTGTCPNFDFKSVQFIMSAHGPSGTYGATDRGVLRLYVLDVDGETVLIQHYGTAATVDALVSSIRFQP